MLYDTKMESRGLFKKNYLALAAALDTIFNF